MCKSNVRSGNPKHLTVSPTKFVHTGSFFIAVLCFVSFIPVPAFAQVSNMSEYPVTSKEVWKIEGDDIPIRETLVTGGVLFTVHAFVDSFPSDKDAAKKKAFAISKFAIENGYMNNAIKLNRFIPGIQVREDIIGVALIYQPAGSRDMSGTRFTFKPSELFPDGVHSKELVPKWFSEADSVGLRATLQSIFDGLRYADLIDLYSEKRRLQLDVSKEKEQANVTWRLAKSIKIIGTGSMVYQGEKDGGPSFVIIYPLEVVPVADESQELPVLLFVEVAETDGIDGINDIKLSFPTKEYLDIFLNHGKTIQFQAPDISK
jgi:hypothetical protein